MELEIKKIYSIFLNRNSDNEFHFYHLTLIQFDQTSVKRGKYFYSLSLGWSIIPPNQDRYIIPKI